DDHLALGDHVHGEVVDAQDARGAVGVDGAEDAVRFAAGQLGADADDVADETCGRGGLVDVGELDATLAGEVLDVDDVDGGVEVRAEQLNRRETQQRVHEARGALAGGAEGDR